MPDEEIAFTACPKIHSHSQIFRYSRNIFCLPHQPNFWALKKTFLALFRKLYFPFIFLCAIPESRFFSRGIPLSARLFYFNFVCSNCIYITMNCQHQHILVVRHMQLSCPYIFTYDIIILGDFHHKRNITESMYLSSDSKPSGLASIKLFVNNLQKNLTFILFKLFSADTTR